MKTELMDSLHALCAASAAQGQDALPGWLARRAEAYFDTATADVLGNVVCHKKGAGKKLMVSAPMDIPGLVALSVDEKGFVHFAAPGVAEPGLLCGAMVRFANGAAGIVCPGAGVDVVTTPPEKLTARELCIDIGAAGRPEGEEVVAAGDVAIPEGMVRELAQGSLLVPRAQALVPCLVAVLAMAQLSQCPNDLYFVFTALASGDMQGGAVAAGTIQPDVCVSLGLADAADAADGEKGAQKPRVGAGPVVQLRQGRIVYSTPAVDFIDRAEKSSKIPCQKALSLTGDTDAVAIQRAGGGVLTGGLGVAARHCRLPGAVVSAKDIGQAAALLAAVVAMAVE